jgi:hypothetical protein
MKSLIMLAAAAAALALAACDQPFGREAETASPPADAPVAPTVTDPTAPVVDTTVPTSPPPTTTLPADQGSSEQSVQPESETLFY